MARGIAPLAGIEDGLAAVEAAADVGGWWAVPKPDPPPRFRKPYPLPGSRGIIFTEWEAKRRLGRAGVPTPPGALVRTPEEAVGAAERIGAPVVVKAVGRDLAHKSDLGAVRLGLETSAEIASAARALLPLGEAVLVERMVTDGVAEVIAGVARDPQVGLTLLVGSGGELVELVGDRALLLLPASRADVEAAVAGLKVARLIDGFRGRPAGDRAALLDALLAIQRFALDHAGRLLELDVNPLIVRPEGRGVAAVDALMRITVEDEDEGEPA